MRLKDISLKEYTIDSLKRIKRLREKLLGIMPEVCIERAKYITGYMRDASSDHRPMEVVYAEAMNYFLSNKGMLFFDDNLLAGTTTSKPFGAPVYPEFTGLTIWAELDTISTREKNPIILSTTDKEVLNREIFPFWMERNIMEYTRKKYNNPECMRIFERIVFFIAGKAGCISHTVPDYSLALEKGLEYILDQAASKEAKIKKGQNISQEKRKKLYFYQAVQTALNGIIAYAAHLSKTASELAAIEQDPLKKKNYQNLAGVCSQVPAKPARTFHEAINALWIIQIAILAENSNMAISPGRLDQILFPYYSRDRERGMLSIEQAMELVGCLWLKFNDNTNLVPEASEELFGGAGTVPSVTIGGIDRQGEDAVNDLTYIMLRVTELLRARDPNLNARYNYKKNTEEYRDRLADVIANTKAVPAIHNDCVDIGILENQGIALEHARDYAIIGCVELSSNGRSYDASSSIMLNLVAALELTLYRGKRPVTGEEKIGPDTGDPGQFKGFKEFWEAFKTQLTWLIEKAIELNEYFGCTHQEIIPTPLLSSFFEGPLKAGKDLVYGGGLYNSSGATHIGFADTVDSLNTIEKIIFQEKKWSFSELQQALKADFTGYEELHAYIVHRAPKYGTSDPIAVKNSKNLIRLLYDLYQKHTNYRGGKYRPAYWTMTNHAGQGKFTGALPNGRKAHKPFASGITPVSQVSGNLSSCCKAVAALDSACIPGGAAFNLKYPSINNGNDLKRFAQAIEAFFRLGGLHVQFNIISYDTLIDARKNPDKYPELLVRVSGYSAYFKDLNEAMKEEIITRTEYNIQTGKAVPFPAGHSSMLAFT